MAEPSREQRDLVAAVTALLRAVARRGETITYSALNEHLGGPVGDLAVILRHVSTSEDEAGRGLLTALVVRDTGRPGRGWFRLARQRGRGGTDEDVWHREVALVHGVHGAGSIPEREV